MKLHFIVFIFLLFIAVPMPCGAQELSQEQLLTPSAQDVLDQIEGRKVTPPKKQDGTFTLSFQPKDTVLSEQQKAKIEGFVSSSKDTQARLKILSYASAPQDSTISARRLSLERALNIRDFLKGKGLSPRRIDVFPMGEQMPPPPTDHVLIRVVGE